MTTFATPAPKTAIEMDLATKALEPHPLNPRINASEGVDELAASIDDVGLLARVTVRPLANGRYQILCGDRRWNAFKKAGKKSIPCVVRTDLDDAGALVLMARENFDRKDLTFIEQGRAYRNLVAPPGQGGLGMKIGDVARRFGVSPATVSALTGALNLPKRWQERIVDDNLSFTAVKALVRYGDDKLVLDECEADYAAAPWAWRSAKDFERSVEQIRERIRGPRPKREDPSEEPVVALTPPIRGGATKEPSAGRATEQAAALAHDNGKPSPATPRPLPFGRPNKFAMEESDQPRAGADRGDVTADDRFADLRDHEFFGVLAPFLGDRRALEAIGNLALRLAVRTGGAR